MRRVDGVMREVIGATIGGELQDPRIGFVTVTAVETSPDLRTAQVHVSVLGSDEEKADTMDGLRAAHGVIQRAIASQLRMKRTPTLTLRLRRLGRARGPADEDDGRVSAVERQRRPRDRSRDRSDRQPSSTAAERFLITTHEGPDGDALGSTLALHQALTQLGKDSVMFLAEKEFPLPVEYRFLPLQEVFHEAPADLSDRTVIFLDCGNIDRMPIDWLRDGQRMLNIDHHHDNTRFADVNLVDVDASSTAEIVFDICRRLGVEVTESIAQALYVGLITDTGQFMYENTDARTHRVAAELIESGVDVNGIFRRLYERVPEAKLKLIARALGRIDRRLDGALSTTYLSADDYAATGADETLTEGIIDFVRGIEGTSVAAVVRDKPDSQREARKVSLRSTDGSVDVSVIARKMGGGGHRRAAGFSTDRSYDELVEFLSDETRAGLG